MRRGSTGDQQADRHQATPPTSVTQSDRSPDCPPAPPPAQCPGETGVGVRWAGWRVVDVDVDVVDVL